jgi:hypothetical protein
MFVESKKSPLNYFVDKKEEVKIVAEGWTAQKSSLKDCPKVFWIQEIIV